MYHASKQSYFISGVCLMLCFSPALSWAGDDDERPNEKTYNNNRPLNFFERKRRDKVKKSLPPHSSVSSTPIVSPIQGHSDSMPDPLEKLERRHGVAFPDAVRIDTFCIASSGKTRPEDRHYISMGDGRIALCDGVSNGYRSGRWAEFLARSFVNFFPRHDSNLIGWVNKLRRNYHRFAPNEPDVTGPAAYARSKGGASTLLGLAYVETDADGRLAFDLLSPQDGNFKTDTIALHIGDTVRQVSWQDYSEQPITLETAEIEEKVIHHPVQRNSLPGSADVEVETSITEHRPVLKPVQIHDTVKYHLTHTAKVSGRAIKTHWPELSIDDADQIPAQLSNKNNSPTMVWGRKRIYIRPGEQLLLVTDALAKCLLAEQLQQPDNTSLAFLLGLQSQADFEDWVLQARETGELDDDDTTLIRINM